MFTLRAKHADLRFEAVRHTNVASRKRSKGRPVYFIHIQDAKQSIIERDGLTMTEYS